DAPRKRRIATGPLQRVQRWDRHCRAMDVRGRRDFRLANGRAETAETFVDGLQCRPVQGEVSEPGIPFIEGGLFTLILELLAVRSTLDPAEVSLLVTASGHRDRGQVHVI